MRRFGRWAVAPGLAATAVLAWLAWPRSEDEGPAARESPPGSSGPSLLASQGRPVAAGHEARPAGPGARPAPAGKDAVSSNLTGRVLDAETLAPVADAQLRWGYVDPTTHELDKDIRGSTASDGALTFAYPRTGGWAPDRPDDPAELWVCAEGYLTAKVRIATSTVEVRLVASRDRTPVTLRVRALRGDGTPWTGLAVVQVADDFGNVEGPCAIADGTGRFTLLAVPPQFTRARLDDRMPWSDLVAASDGSADVELRGGSSEPLASLSTPDLLAWRDEAAAEMESAGSSGDADRRARAEGRWGDAWTEFLNRQPAQRPFVVTHLPPDATDLAEVRVETRGYPRIWRLRVVERTLTLCTPRDGAYWWRISVARPGGVLERRGITVLGEREGQIDARTGPADRDVRSFPLREDGALVVDWEQLVPDS